MRNSTGIDFHVSSSLLQKVGSGVATVLLGLVVGGGSMGLTDVFNAKTFVADKAKEIAEAEAVRARVVALEAQVVILMDLVARKQECN